MPALAGKMALVTGGGGGIGAACAGRLVADGASVLLLGREEAKLARARQSILTLQPNAIVTFFAGDAAQMSTIESALATIGKVDIVVATVGGSAFRPLLDHSAETFLAQIEANLIPPFLAVRATAPRMAKGGSIVCISSNVAKINFRHLSAYATAKAALEAFVRSAADELGARGIRVNAVRPGLVRVERTARLSSDAKALAAYAVETPLADDEKACALPEDIAEAVRYLAGPESGWVTGQSFAVDGGQELRRNPDPTSF
jgi:NAD(P)-dependent dehydrogenase (short-subunit alcohol dehydrogenase family)